jgi:hypothetical protein
MAAVAKPTEAEGDGVLRPGAAPDLSANWLNEEEIGQSEKGAKSEKKRKGSEKGTQLFSRAKRSEKGTQLFSRAKRSEKGRKGDAALFSGMQGSGKDDGKRAASPFPSGNCPDDTGKKPATKPPVNAYTGTSDPIADFCNDMGLSVVDCAIFKRDATSESNHLVNGAPNKLPAASSQRRRR